MLHKKDSKKVKKKRPSTKIEEGKEAFCQAEQDTNISFHFGGLPTQDLKKNLGCG
jgi:hypothetical protein